MGRSASKPAAALLDDQAIGLEARSHHDDHLSLRLWLRLLACRSDYIRIGRRTVAHTLVALTDTQVGAGGYQALWGGQGKGGRHDVVAAHCTVDPTAGQAG